MSGQCKEKTYSVISFPASRVFTSDIGVLGSRKHHVKALLEFDVTDARAKIREAKAAGSGVSFTAWMLSCIAKALAEHRQVHALLCGRRKLMLFDEVDISLMIEKTSGDHRVPVPYVLRRAEAKTVAEIHGEIERAKAADLAGAEGLDHTRSAGAAVFVRLPQCVRLFIWKLILGNPRRVKKLMGTALFTSVGMFGSAPGWAVPFSIHPVSFTLGSITRKPVFMDGQLHDREILHLTILIDHDVVDGAPAARFAARLRELIEGGEGL